MSEVSSDAQQCAVHMVLGFIPVLKVRKAVPNDSYSFEWGRWRYARFGEVTPINSILMQTWRK